MALLKYNHFIIDVNDINKVIYFGDFTSDY